MSSLEGKRYVVTGAASGIGAATAARLKAAGAYVASLDRQEASENVDVHHDVDMSDPFSIDAVVGTLGDGWDGLLNIAGVSGASPAELVIKVNFLGLRHLTEALIGGINEGGAIVNVSSIADVMWPTRAADLAAFVGTKSFDDGLAHFREHPPEGKTYNWSKEAVTYYTMAKALESAKSRVRVNAIRPGLTRTPLFEDFTGAMGEERVDGVRAMIGRFCEPDDIARAIVYLASPEADLINGQCLAIDGGLTAGMAVGQVPLPGVK